MYIVVLAGGLSPERDVSLSTGTRVCRTLNEMGHKAVLIDLYLGLNELPDPIERLFTEDTAMPQYAVKEQMPDLESIRAMRGRIGFSVEIGKFVIDACLACDMVFLAMHGGNGENGRVQALFDMLGIRYTGTGQFGSAVAMNKWASKCLFTGAGIRTPKGVLLRKEDTPHSISPLSLPVVVKPCCGGSSIGISIAKTEDALTAAIAEAFRYEDEVIVEEYIRGKEIAAGVLGGAALPLIEIIPRGNFYDYQHKYQPGWTEEITPARIPADVTRRMQETAIAACRALRVEVYARVDFLLRPDGAFFCLEVNTLPGMTKTSLLPQEAAAAGLDYPALCDKIVQLSLRKYSL